MKRKLSVLSIGLITFLVVTASAASLGSGVTSAVLSAGSATVTACGNPGAISVSYDTVDTSGTVYVDKVKLTSASTGGDAWTGGTSCIGKNAYVTLGNNATNAPILLTTEMTSGTGGSILTLDVTNVTVTSVSSFSIVIQG